MTNTQPPRPPTPPGHWFLGNLPDFRRDMLGFFTRCNRQYGDLVALRFGHRHVHLATHPDFVEQILVTEYRNFGKSYVFELLRPVLGNGLVNSEGAFWLRQRRLMQPAFSRASVANYAPAILDSTRRMLDDWRSGETRDLHREMNRLALAIVGKALMDVDLGNVGDEISQPLEESFHDFSHRFESLWHFPMWVPTPRNLRAKRNVRLLDTVVNRIIRQRRASGGDRGDLLSKLIAARDEEDQTGMTDRQLRDEVMTLFLAGHETTANALAWTWFLLAQNPEPDARLAAELNTVLGDREPTAADLPQLPYTEAVVKESMRLFPPVFAFSRRVLRDTVIGGFHIPARSAVIMSQWVIHRDPRWWPDADQFKPERWLSDLPLTQEEGRGEGVSSRTINSSMYERSPYAYFPFGAGPRGCIGNQFAMLEATLAVASIAARFRFELIASEKVRPWPSVTLRPAAGGIPAVIHRRQPAASAVAAQTRSV
jgi:cytochrome P450